MSKNKLNIIKVHGIVSDLDKARKKIPDEELSEICNDIIMKAKNKKNR